MKVIIALLLAFSLSPFVISHTLRGKGEDEAKEARNLLPLHDESHQIPKIDDKAKSKSRFIVKYNSEAGKKMVEKVATNVYYDFKEQSSMVIDLDEVSLYNLKAELSDIVAVDEDTPIHQQSVFLGNYDPKKHRHLTQVTPYGVPMVQADQISMPLNLNARVKVCLVDTGVLYSHPDLPQWLMAGANRFSTSFQTQLYWQKGVDGHGTCLAGIVSASTANNLGLRGVGNIPLFVTRGMNDQGQSMQSDILDAINQCVASGAKIISLSLGGSGLSDVFKSLLDTLYDVQGKLIFAAAGNNGQEYAMYPAAYSKVISVGAVNQSGLHWHASNTGPSLELSAPGDNVWCTGIKNGGPTYSQYSGTSMATPFAAGVAAVVWSYFPSCTNSQIRFALSYTAKKIGGGCNTIYGNGIVQAKAAYDFLAAHPCSGASWGKTISAIGCENG